MQLDEIIHKVSEELNIPYEVCHKAYMSAWKFIYSKVQEHELSENVSLEEFKTYRPNINIRGIGKFYITPESFERKNKKFEIIRKYKKEKYDKSNKDD